MFPALAMMVRAGLEKQKRRETAKEVERCVLEPGVAWWSRDVGCSTTKGRVFGWGVTWFLRGWSFYDELHNSDTSCLRVDQVDSIPTPLGELNYANFLNKNQPTIKSNHQD